MISVPTPARAAVAAASSHRRVVIADVLDALLRDVGEDVFANHGVHQGIRAGRQLVQAGAGHRVAGQHHRSAIEFDPEPDRRRHRSVIGRRHPDRHAVAIPHRAVGVFVDLDRRRRVQVGVMGDPVADVVAERLQRRLHRLGGARGPDDRQRRRIGREVGDPTGDDDVAEFGDVVAVQVGEQQRRQSGGTHTDRRRALQHATPAIDQEHLCRRPAPGWTARRGSGRGWDFRFRAA